MKDIGLTNFKKLFRLIICDNGTEFSKLYKVENLNNNKIVDVFYANPHTEAITKLNVKKS